MHNPTTGRVGSPARVAEWRGRGSARLFIAYAIAQTRISIQEQADGKTQAAREDSETGGWNPLNPSAGSATVLSS